MRLPPTIVDNAVPGFDGQAALRLARALCPEIPAMVLSGSGDRRQVEDSLQAGAADYLLKDRPDQGKTVDEVLVVAASRSLPAVHRQQFYVSISRGRERCQVFTDDMERLRSHVTHSSERLAAIEATNPIHRQPFIQRILQRGHRFLRQFRQRISRSPSIREGIDNNRQSIYEHQHQSRRGIRV